MTRTRVIVAAAVAATLAGAQLARVAAYAAGPDDEADALVERPAPRPVTAPPALPAAPKVPAAEAQGGQGAAPAGRVSAGVLARAVSHRLREREASAKPPERRGGRQGDILSIEIQWHAASTTP